MSADERGVSDAIFILEAVAKLIRATPNRDMGDSWIEMHAGYLEDAAQAAARDAGVDAEVLRAGRAYVGSEWISALAPIFFAPDEVNGIYRSMGYPV